MSWRRNKGGRKFSPAMGRFQNGQNRGGDRNEGRGEEGRGGGLVVEGVEGGTVGGESTL